MFLKKEEPNTSPNTPPISTSSGSREAGPSTSPTTPFPSGENFKADFEQNMNKALESERREPPPSINHHDAGPYPPPPPPATMPYTFSLPPFPRRSGVYVPMPILVILVLVFLLETSVIVVYTAVALYSTLPAAGFPIRAMRCPPQPSGYGINVAPNIFLAPHPQTDDNNMILTATIPTSTATPPTATVTAEVSTRTHFSTLPAVPSITTSTVLSTSIVPPTPGTVTSVVMVTRSP